MSASSPSQFIFLLGTAVFLLLGYLQTAHGSRFSEESEEEPPSVPCRRLPPNPERTSIAGESNLNIVDVLNNGLSKLLATCTNARTVNGTPRDVILILGNSGAGKTTVTQILTSNLSRLHSVKTYSGQSVIVDDDERIGVPTTVSRTLIPELVTLIPPPSPSTSSEEYDDTTSPAPSPSPIYFYDCPGFDDTRGPEFDLAANLFINQIIRNAHRVKLLFLVTQSAVTEGEERFSFNLLVNHAVTFVRNLARFENSIGLVVTKVKNFTPGKVHLQPDGRILRKIVGFLTVYNQTLSAQLNALHNTGSEEEHSPPSAERDQILRKLHFLRILLHKDANDAYDRISFSREPIVCGPLGNSDTVTNSKKKMTELYQRLEYGDVGSPRNFDYTLKPLTIQKLQNFSKDINNAITRNVQNVMHNFTDWFDESKFLENDKIVTLSTTLQAYWSDVESLLQNISPQSLPEFGTSLQSLLERMGYHDPTGNLWEFQQFMRKQEESLNFFEQVIGATGVDRFANEWVAPIVAFHKKLGEYRDWYRFCVQVKNRVVSYDFHTNRPAAPVPSQRDSPLEWSNWIGQHGNIFVGEHLKCLANNLTGKHGGVLANIMKWSMEPLYIACAGGSTTVKGNFVRFGEFLEGNGQLKGQCSGATTIQVYAADRAFIDANVDAVGKEMSMVVVAPRWEVKGKVLLNLNGGHGPDIHPGKAANGQAPGAEGWNGEPGKPGGPGGVFLGVAGEIQRAAGLTVSVVGGNGGRGQDGGDGAEGHVGLQEGYTKITTNTIVHFVRVVGYHGSPGGAGGNGGMGGVGGLGGHAGYVKIVSNDGGKVEIIKRDGVRGQGGAGGLWGHGGKGSTSQYCTHKVTVFISHGGPCIWEKKPDGPHGHRGFNDKAEEGLQQPKHAFTAPDVKFATDFFRGMYYNSGNRETTDFINTFA